MPNSLASIERTPYRYSGKVDARRFVAALAGALAASQVVAGCMAWVMNRSVHVPFMIPGLLLAPAAWAVFWTVRAGRCRNRTAAAVAGSLVMLACHFGSYHLRHVAEAGARALHRIDQPRCRTRDCRRRDNPAGRQTTSPAGTAEYVVWEMPLLPRPTGLAPSTNRRRLQLAETLCARILAATAAPSR